MNYPVFERIVWFHRQTKERRYPNASILARYFEISPKTAQRNIDFMRDRLAAPIEYDPSRKGYVYTDQSFELPHFPITQEEILALLIARNLLSSSAGGIISRALNNFEKKLLAAGDSTGLDTSRLGDIFSATWTGYSPASPEIFQKTAHALVNQKILKFVYVSPRTGEFINRQVEPHHLQHYMASWVLTAWCRLRKDWRKFFLARMDSVSVLDERFLPRPVEEWKKYVENAFGIFQGETQIRVTLRFTPFRARWIREQIWHPDQEIKYMKGGSLELSIPVTDFREIKMKILQFGADVVVVEPVELKMEIRAEIQKMMDLYGGKE